jgi:hypothetical protein
MSGTNKYAELEAKLSEVTGLPVIQLRRLKKKFKADGYTSREFLDHVKKIGLARGYLTMHKDGAFDFRKVTN